MTERDRYEEDERGMMEQNGEDAKVAMVFIACLPFLYLALVGLSSLLSATP